MKKTFCIIFLIGMTVTNLVYGQFPASYGVKAGLSIANQSWKFTNLDYTLETDPLYSASVALFMEAFKGEHFSFQFDAAYELKGSSTSVQSITVQHFNNDQITVNAGALSTSSFKYLSFSPMARYRFDLENLVPYFLLGPRIDMLLSYTSDSENPLESWRGYAVGLTIGAGMEYSFGQFNLFTEIQYQPDLSPLTNHEPLLINNNMLVITLGVRTW
ncbi:MAG: outer membrane beta-barrel protein [Bacteroidota bacterium]